MHSLVDLNIALIGINDSNKEQDRNQLDFCPAFLEKKFRNLFDFIVSSSQAWTDFVIVTSLIYYPTKYKPIM
ncbi:hypothetical protein CD126_00510 [Staphylococcus pettenkoferi]|nr:hypothetical protein CD126_00510 [Staphylococcus pettenkoferi]